MSRTTPSAGIRPARIRIAAVVAATAVLALIAPAASNAAPVAPTAPNLVPLLSGFSSYWNSDGKNDLHGTVVNATVLARNDELTSWINQHATSSEKFRALQDSEYENATNTTYDQSYTVSTGLGSVLSALYVQGRNSGALPLTTALINSSTGESGAFVSTSSAKATFSYPRPYLAASASATPVSGDVAGCAPSVVNASSLTPNRIGTSSANTDGSLKITRVVPAVDTTHQFSPNAVTLDPGYGTTGLCTGGSFPSGHTTTAYEAGITLATLLPELAPEILARASENGNDRIVLGVHYPLDIMGGRIDGEAALATLWSDATYRTQVLEPARTELVNYLQKACGKSLAACIASEKPYTSNPYGGEAMPGGTAQIVTNRASALKVYTERMTYGFQRTSSTHQAASVPAGAENLLMTTFPTLTDAQRTAVLAQTEIGAGYPLDGTGTAAGSWERLNLAAAMSATVLVGPHGQVCVIWTGGAARVIRW